MPYSAQAWVFYFNKGLLRGAGLSEPQTGWTWTDWLEMMRKGTKYADDPEQGIFGFWVFYFPNICRSLLRTMDADFVSADGTRVTVNTPQALEAVQFVADLINRHRVAPANPQRPQREVLFNTNKVLFTDDAGQKPLWTRNNLAVGATHWPVHPTIKKRAQSVSHNNVAVYQQSDAAKVAAAVKFMKWWAGPQQIATYARLGGNLPVHKAASELPEWANFAKTDPFAKIEADEVARYGYASVPKLPAANRALAAINTQIGNDVRDGKVAVKEALINAEQAANAALRGQ
jgi:multiple sugar transport system substrate-binding protein